MDLANDVAVPDEEDVLIDTALYHAAAERTGRARALVGRGLGRAVTDPLGTHGKPPDDGDRTQTRRPGP